MNAWWQALLSIGSGLALMWLALVVALLIGARRPPDRATVTSALRLLPDVIRLTRRLASDLELPCGVRWSLWLVLAYLLLPIDLIPDFVPVLGYADDAMIVALVLRSVVRAAGPDALERHWPGTPDGLAVIRRLCRLDDATA